MTFHLNRPSPPSLGSLGEARRDIEPQRFQTLDSWRGLCALMVVFYHFRVISHLSVLDVVRHGDVAVDFFFVLSGFVIAHAYGARLGRGGGVVQFVIRRWGRLYPLHFVMLMIMVAIELARLAAAMMTGHAAYRPPFAGPTSLVTLAANLALVHGLGLFRTFSWNIPSWSISVEFYVCLLYALLASAKSSKTLLFLTLVVVFLIRAGLWLDRIWLYEGDLALLRGLSGFFLGVQVYRVFKLADGRLSRAARYVEWLFPLAFSAVIFLETHGEGFLSPIMFAVLVFIFAMEAGSISRWLRSRPLAFLGRISYSIYLTHYILVLTIFGIVGMIGQHIGWALRTWNGILFIDVQSPWIGDLVQLTFAALVIGCSALSYRYIETPGRILCNQIALSLTFLSGREAKRDIDAARLR